MERKKGENPFGARMGEASFCIIYLIYIFVIAGVLWSKYKMSDTIDYTETYYLYKIRYISGFVMAMFLGCGDAFHLVPRIIVNIKDGIKNQEFYLGLGNLVSSITMTVFYLVMVEMCELCMRRTSGGKDLLNDGLFVVTVLFVTIRIILCLFPQNRWFTKEGNKKWAVIRNAPFVVVGIMAVVTLIIATLTVITEEAETSFSVFYPGVLLGKGFFIQIMVATILSFAFYLPVAIKGKENPKLGMLMIPKTVCYMWMMGVICWG